MGEGGGPGLSDGPYLSADGRLLASECADCGHPIGPTGFAQIVAVTHQHQRRAGARQVEGATLGMTHVTGGGVSGLDHGACTMHILGV